MKEAGETRNGGKKHSKSLYRVLCLFEMMGENKMCSSGTAANESGPGEGGAAAAAARKSKTASPRRLGTI